MKDIKTCKSCLKRALYACALLYCTATISNCSDNTCSGIELDGHCISSDDIEVSLSECQDDSDCHVENAESTACIKNTDRYFCVVNQCKTGYQTDATRRNCIKETSSDTPKAICQTNQDCLTLYEGASSAECVHDSDMSFCRISACKEGYHPYGDNECEIDDVNHCGTHDHSCMKIGVDSAECSPTSGTDPGMSCVLKCMQGYHLKYNDQNEQECAEDSDRECGDNLSDCSDIPHTHSAYCKEGKCFATECDSGYKIMNNECVDDSDNMCCGKDCIQCDTNNGLTCQSGVCQSICQQDGQTYCGDRCVNTDEDALNCGECGNVCKPDGIDNAETMKCVDKVCVIDTCKDNLTLIEGECRRCILFVDDEIKQFAMTHWDTNGDLCIDPTEADEVTEIPDNAFQKNKALKSLSDLKQFKNLRRIGHGAFEDTDNTKSETIDLPGVTEIGDMAFACMFCDDVQLNLPKVETIGEGAFAFRHVGDLFLPNVKTIGRMAFLGCHVESLKLPQLIQLGEEAFEHCSGFKTLLPDTFPMLKTIAKSAFSSTELETVDLPNVKTIDAFAFSDCSHLRQITFQSAEVIGNVAFSGTISLKSVNLPKALELGSQAFIWSGIEEIILPEVKAIEFETFDQCRSLETVKFPKIEKLGTHIFSRCDKLTTISMTSRNKISYKALFESPSNIWSNSTDIDPPFDPANVSLTLHANKEIEVKNGNEWLGAIWKTITYIEE